MTTAVAPAPSKSAAQRKRSSARGPGLGTRRGNIIAGIAAWAVGILFVFPVFFMVLTSLHSEVNASTNPPSFFAPLTLQGYKEFFGASSGASPWPPLLNSATASIISTILVIVLAIPAAYALAVRPIKKWTDAMFFFLSTKMLPAVAGLLPLYIFAKYLGLLDNINYLLILYTAMTVGCVSGFVDGASTSPAYTDQHLSDQAAVYRQEAVDLRAAARYYEGESQRSAQEAGQDSERVQRYRDFAQQAAVQAMEADRHADEYQLQLF